MDKAGSWNYTEKAGTWTGAPLGGRFFCQYLFPSLSVLSVVFHDLAGWEPFGYPRITRQAVSLLIGKETCTFSRKKEMR